MTFLTAAFSVDANHAYIDMHSWYVEEELRKVASTISGKRLHTAQEAVRKASWIVHPYVCGIAFFACVFCCLSPHCFFCPRSWVSLHMPEHTGDCTLVHVHCNHVHVGSGRLLW